MAPRTERSKDSNHSGDDHADVIPLRGPRVDRVVHTGAGETEAGTAVDEARWSEVLGDVLRDEWRRQGRTLADVAERAAVSLPYLSEVERGRKEISSDLLTAVISSLEVDLATVLERAAGHARAGVAHSRGAHSGGAGSARLLAA